MPKDQPYRVAIACQGGVGYTAFTAGVLKKLLHNHEDKFEIVALSGTADGAIWAFLTWYGLLKGDSAESIKLLDEFWANSTSDTYWAPPFLTTASDFYQSQFTSLEYNPYWFPDRTRENMESLLKKIVNFQRISTLIHKNNPKLFVGAVDVLSGQSMVFQDKEITLDALIASNAIPDFSRGVRIGDKLYWDGLLSSNPPIGPLTEAKPDEIWIIQINRPYITNMPRTIDEIRDRRNELSSSHAMEREIFNIMIINNYIAKGVISNTNHKKIEVRRIRMLREIPQSSKFDRSPQFVSEMMAYGENQAEDFIKALFFYESKSFQQKL